MNKIMENLFKTVAFGGYDKSEVYNYLHELNSTFEFKMQEKDAEIKKLKGQLKDKKDEKPATPQGKLSVALEAKIKQQRAELKVLQAELAGLKKMASEALKKFADKLDKLN
jgi:cell division septum initiation protein DivIVA